MSREYLNYLKKIIQENEIKKIPSKETKQENKEQPVQEPTKKTKKNVFRRNIKVKNQNHKQENIVIDGEDTHIPRNMPTALIASKGSGKTTLLRSIIETTYKTIFKHIYFVFVNTLDDDMPDFITRIPLNDCEQFLQQLFSTKALFNSYYTFFKKFDVNKVNLNSLSLSSFTSQYFDNNILNDNKDILNSNIQDRDKIGKIIDNGEKFIRDHQQPFTIMDVSMEPLEEDDNDLVIIDDMGVAGPILFKTIQKSIIYPYFTLTRHINTAIILSGQTVFQIPKMIRREIDTWILSKGVSLADLANHISQRKLAEIEKLQTDLQPYEFVCYNTTGNEEVHVI